MSAERLQQVAVQHFADRGFAAVGIRELSREVGVSSATLYHYAASKEAVLAGIMRACLDELVTAAERGLRSSDNPAGRLAALVCVHVAMSALNPLTSRVTDHELWSLTAENRAQLIATRDRYEQLWTAVLRVGQRTRVFALRPSELRTTRLALIDMCNGIANWYDPSGSLSVRGLQRRYVELACRLVGIAQPVPVPAISVAVLASEPLRKDQA